MSIVSNTIYLDVSQNKYVMVVVPQRDYKSRDLYIIPTSNGETIPLLATYDATATIVKPDSNIVIQSCTVDVDNNWLKLTFVDQVTSVSGLCECQIIITNIEQEVLHTMKFNIKIINSLKDHLEEKIVSSDAFITLEEELAAVTALSGQLNDATTEAKTAASESTESAASSKSASTLSQSYAVGGTGTRDGEDTDNAKYYYTEAAKIGTRVDEAKAYANTAQSYAVGGTGTRTDEDIDNAKYYYSQTNTLKSNVDNINKNLKELYDYRQSILATLKTKDDLPDPSGTEFAGLKDGHTFLIANSFTIDDWFNEYQSGETVTCEAGTAVYKSGTKYSYVTLSGGSGSGSLSGDYLTTVNPSMKDCSASGTGAIALGADGDTINHLEDQLIPAEFNYNESTHSIYARFDKYLTRNYPTVNQATSKFDKANLIKLVANCTYKNVIPTTYDDVPQKDYGVSFNIANYAVIATGTATGNAEFRIVDMKDTYTLWGGAIYTLSGCPNLSGAKFVLKINNSSDSNSWQTVEQSGDVPTTFKVNFKDGDTDGNYIKYQYQLYIYIATGTKPNNTSFKPFLHQGGDHKLEYCNPGTSSTVTYDLLSNSFTSQYVSVAGFVNETGMYQIKLLGSSTDYNFVVFDSYSKPTSGDFRVDGTFYQNAISQGDGAVVIGTGCKAVGSNSYALGDSSYSDNECGFALGKGLVASNTNFAIGQYNDDSSAYAFSIGNGTSATDRKNIVTVDDDGVINASNVTINTSSDTTKSLSDLFTFSKVFKKVTLTYNAQTWKEGEVTSKTVSPTDYDSAITKKNLVPIGIYSYTTGTVWAIPSYINTTNGTMILSCTSGPSSTLTNKTPSLTLMCIRGDLIS